MENIEDDHINKFSEILKLFNAELSVTMEQVENLKRVIKKEIRPSKRSQNRCSDIKSKRISSFLKPQIVSDSLCEFMNVSNGTLISRLEATRYILNYIKNNDCQDKTKIRLINLDCKLKKVFEIDNLQTISYFSMQKYIDNNFNHHQTI